jgi:hypothetical protein
MRPLISMRRALEDQNIFGLILPGESWAAWRVLLIACMGEPLTDDERIVFKELTGRDRETTGERVEEFWAIIGRRGGKTRAIAVLAAYLAALTDFSDVLAPGEIASLPILSNTTDQAQKCLQYLNGIFSDVPALRRLVIGQTADSITLSTRVCISVQPANWRTVRGGTAIAIICDEVATWRSDSLANPDAEILAAARPCLGTTGGMLACISSPYARRGVLWETHKRDYGQDGDPSILVARAPSARMNSTLKQSWIKKQFERDPFRAAAEYGAEFRTDIESFVSQEAVERCVSPGVFERLYTSAARYVAFVDAAGGSGQDSMTMAIAHAERDAGRDIAVLDVLREHRPPFSPQAVIGEFCETLSAYNLKAVTGDKFAGDFCAEQFRMRGIAYHASERTKSEIYVELLPRINTGSIDLLDNARMIAQLCNLERRTGRGTGREVIDHPRDQHDDLVNSATGALLLASARKKAFRPTQRQLQLASMPAPYRRRLLGDPAPRPTRGGIPIV